VVTVTYSPGEHLRAFMDSLAQATGDKPRVILADNGSVDGVPEAVADEYEQATLVRTGGNLGYGAGANRGVAEIGPEVEFVLIANPDLRFGPGALDELIAAAQRWPRAGAFGPLVREPDGSVYPSARAVPDLLTGTGHALFGQIWKSNPWTRKYHQDRQVPSERTVGWLSGCCLLVRRAAFDSIDGFDSRYFMYMEDVDFGDRLGTAGWHNVYVPTAEVTHDKGHAAGKRPEAMTRAHHDGVYRFIADRHARWWHSPLRLGLRAGLGVRLRVALRAARSS
jgi:N-acetylglucosaminyl-diphospho-decaprenol L-rhamnosyltransferase